MTRPIAIPRPQSYARPKMFFVGTPPSARVIVTYD